MKIFPLRNVKMPTIVFPPIIVGILISMSMVNNILGYSETKKAEFLDHDFYTYEHLKFHAQLS